MLSSSVRILSGAFQTVTLGVDQQLTGNGGGVERANQLLSNPLCDHVTLGPNVACGWINPAAFQAVSAMPLGTLGNSGRSSIPGPGFWDFDMALSRLFHIREKMTVEARGEAFNLTNSFRAGAPGQPTVITARNNTAQFGQILFAQDPRILQVAMKFVF